MVVYQGWVSTRGDGLHPVKRLRKRSCLFVMWKGSCLFVIMIQYGWDSWKVCGIYSLLRGKEAIRLWSVEIRRYGLFVGYIRYGCDPWKYTLRYGLSMEGVQYGYDLCKVSVRLLHVEVCGTVLPWKVCGSVVSWWKHTLWFTRGRYRGLYSFVGWYYLDIYLILYDRMWLHLG